MEKLFEYAGLMTAHYLKADIMVCRECRAGGNYRYAHYNCDQIEDQQI